MRNQSDIIRGVMRRQKLSFILFTLLITSCSVDRYIADDELFLKEVNVVETNPQATKSLSLADYVLQQPNNKWFGAKVPLKIYCLGGVDSTNWATRLFHKIGQKPVIYDQRKATRTVEDMRQVLYNEGYVHANVDIQPNVKGKHLSLTYVVAPGEQYRIHSISRNIADNTLSSIICGDDTASSLLQQGMPFNINRLNEERNRITTHLRNIGYYKFNKEYITFVADTSALSNDVDITMNIGLHIEDGRSNPEPHRRYTIGDISYIIDGGAGSDLSRFNKEVHQGATIYYTDHLRFRPGLLTSNTLFHTGDYFNENNQKLTYRYLTRLGAISYSNIRMEQAGDSLLLECPPDSDNKIEQDNRRRLTFFDSHFVPQISRRTTIAASVLVLMFLLSSFHIMPLMATTMLAAGAMVLFRCCRIDHVTKYIDWELLLIIGSTIVFSVAITKTGVTDVIATSILNLCGSNPYVVMVVMCLLASIVSEFVSDVGSSAVFFPIIWQQSQLLGCNPMPFIMSLMLSVTISFASPIGSSTHILIYGPGSFRFTDFARLGVIMHIVLLAVCLVIVNLIYPLYHN